ncbi:CRAL-TRIO domain-containing protein [Mucidula mucida]|nr:CRAL-TRIO domain-containing protein [Mucidula mucida]
MATPAPVTEPRTVEVPKEEPQNALTQAFTQAEWTALKEFRKQLPEIFSDGYPDKKDNKDAPITFWGVVIDPWKPANDARVSVILVKFLRARNLNVKAAREMLVNTLRWRDEIGIDALMKEEFPQEIFGALGHIYKTDKQGRPVSYNVYGGNKDIKAVFGDVPRFIRWRVKLMEETVAQCDFVTVDQTVQIHDYEGVSMSSRDANSKQAASEASNVFSSHYPELLSKKFFINVPTLMSWIFWFFKTFIPSATFAKMNMVGTSTHEIKKALLAVIDEENLPKRYGGLAEGF